MICHLELTLIKIILDNNLKIKLLIQKYNKIKNLINFYNVSFILVHMKVEFLNFINIIKNKKTNQLILIILKLKIFKDRILRVEKVLNHIEIAKNH